MLQNLSLINHQIVIDLKQLSPEYDVDSYSLAAKHIEAYEIEGTLTIDTSKYESVHPKCNKLIAGLIKQRQNDPLVWNPPLIWTEIW